LLLTALLDEFVSYSNQNDFIPLFLWMPQKDDILSIQELGRNYFDHFTSKMQTKMHFIDLTESFLNNPQLDRYYSDDNIYGGHLSYEGNELVAKVIHQYLKEKRLLIRENNAQNVKELV
jgi:hypothetical protein